MNLIKGFDGGAYEPDGPALVRRVREALLTEGLYSGELRGVLDEPTMNALGNFERSTVSKLAVSHLLKQASVF